MPLRNPVRPVIDSIVIATLLVVANLILGSGDRGWLGLNPSPFLLLPLLIGGKYGLRAGFAAGLAALAIVLGLSVSAGAGLMEILKNTPLVFLSMPVIGLISGELHRQSAGGRAALASENAGLVQATSTLAKDLELSRESQHLLQKELSVQGADVCSLDLELRKIFEPNAPPILRGTLGVLVEVGGVTGAGFYLLGSDGETLQRSEFVGDAGFFPESIGRKHNKMAWAAIESNELVTCRGLGEGRVDVGKAKFLAAVPWRREGKVAGVLLVHDMPFLSMNWQTLARIELVCDWVGAMEDLQVREGAGETLGAVDFKTMLGMAGRSLEEQGLPSAIALLTAVGAITVGEMREVIAGELRPSHVVVEVGGRGLAVLLPLEAGRDARGSTDRYLGALAAAGKEAEGKLWTIDEIVDADSLWDEMVASMNA